MRAKRSLMKPSKTTCFVVLRSSRPFKTFD